MDPLSISLACISLIGAITRTSTVVTNFVRDVRGVKSELDRVSRELQSLKAVLEILAGDAGDPTKGSLPETLKRQIAGIVTNCTGVVAEIELTLKRHEGTGLAKAARWSAIGQGDISKLRSSLEAHKSALEIALDMVTLYGYSVIPR
jgi:Fungal N-terminal domain of STAND proteins